MKRFVLTLGLAALLGGSITPAYADFDEWLKGIMDAPGRHAGKHYRDKRPPTVVDPMKEIRNRMVAGKEVSYKELRQLADSGDDLAAYNLAKRIEDAAEPAELPTAIAYYTQAVEGGRTFALRPIVRLLDAGTGADDPDLLARAEKLLLDKSVKEASARDALIRMYRAGKPFGLHPEKADELLIASATEGDSKAALDLAFALLTGTTDAAKIAQAKVYLRIAAASETLNIRTMAENVLRTLEPQLTASTETVQ